MNEYFQMMFLSVLILTLRLLRSQDQNSDLDRVRLADSVRDGQLELVNPRCQIGHDHLVTKAGCLRGIKEDSVAK